jgi:uncharacterized MAPEG superfamily protein
MTTALWCILIAGLLPYICAGTAKWGFHQFDNNNPRQWLANQTGFRARANAAQHNSFEAFPFFASAVIIASFTQAPSTWINVLAIMFVIARVGFIVCYVMDKPKLRTLCWTAGVSCVIALFVISGMQAA